MTPLEKTLAFGKWTQDCSQSWTTVKNGIGFALYRLRDKMWLCGYPPKVVEERRKLHRDKAPYITIYSDPQEGSMFNIPASDDFVSAVILKHFPELQS
jgi:hypothetical protein